MAVYTRNEEYVCLYWEINIVTENDTVHVTPVFLPLLYISFQRKTSSTRQNNLCNHKKTHLSNPITHGCVSRIDTRT